METGGAGAASSTSWGILAFRTLVEGSWKSPLALGSIIVGFAGLFLVVVGWAASWLLVEAFAVGVFSETEEVLGGVMIVLVTGFLGIPVPMGPAVPVPTGGAAVPVGTGGTGLIPSMRACSS